MFRVSKLASQLSATDVSGGRTSQSDYIVAYRARLRECQAELRQRIDDKNCGPILVRFAWHDSGTYDKSVTSFPECGGANGSIRFNTELKHAANAGLKIALGLIKDIKDKYPDLSWADVIQLASVTAIEQMGGPVIPIPFGRVDTTSESECPKEGNLPAANPPFDDGSPDAATHLRRVFYRMGFNDGEIVALSGAHTVGRAWAERSGTVKEGVGKGTKFTKCPFAARFDGKQGLGTQGARSWTPHWLSFNTEVFNFDKESKQDQSELLQLSTDACLYTDPKFKVYKELYARNQARFFKDYTAAHIKLSQLGSKFIPEGGFLI